MSDFQRLRLKAPTLRFAATTALALSMAPLTHAAEAGADQGSSIIVTGVHLNDGYVPKETGAAKIAIPLKDLPQSVAVVPSEVLRDPRPVLAGRAEECTRRCLLSW